ncbi:MAG: OadG family protein [Desulfobacteraceae bacterium]
MIGKLILDNVISNELWRSDLNAIPRKQQRELKLGGEQVQGLAAITAQNGWAMAATGACIVIAGLSVLSFIISQLHRIIAFFEKSEKPVPAPAPEPKKPQAKVIEIGELDAFSDLQATARHLLTITEPFGETFKLADLYKVMDSANLAHPHITVRELKSAGYLAPADEGTFSWKNV